jgi:hypothetical protein
MIGETNPIAGTDAYARLLADYERRIADLERAAQRGVTAWTQLPLVNSWANYSAPYGPALYRKVGDEVQLRGLSQGGAAGTALCTMPVGYRPQYEPIFSCTCSHPTAGWTGIVEVRVSTAGVVNITSSLLPQSGWPAAASPGTWVSLASIRFSVL